MVYQTGPSIFTKRMLLGGDKSSSNYEKEQMDL